MDLRIQKRLAADLLKCSPKRVIFDTARLEEIKESITKEDIRKLISGRAIVKNQKKGISKFNVKHRQSQKIKGRRRGHGSRKGKKGARQDPKQDWMNRVRLQRAFLNQLREKKIIDGKTFRDLYLKSKGGFFRSKRHIKVYMEEKKLAKQA